MLTIAVTKVGDDFRADLHAPSEINGVADLRIHHVASHAVEAIKACLDDLQERAAENNTIALRFTETLDRARRSPGRGTLMPQLFSYGTLQQPEVQHATFERLLTGRRDELAQFRVARVGRHANAAFTGNPEDRVAGTSFDVTDDELERADEYERQDDSVRIEVVLISGARAWIYVHSARVTSAP
jgi:gamma-glutamylcyclotransferase (GGCT)/AIG2-like uncharacterized protein YtfP